MIARLATVLGLLLALVACGGPSPGARQEPVAPPPDTPAGAAAPAAVTVPAIDAHSSLYPTGLNPDGTVEVPPDDDPMQASWFDRWPAPGETGPAIILGHVDGEIDGQPGQPGIFYNLDQLARGDEITVERERGPPARFVVYDTEQAPKDAFPAERVYDPTAGPELRLVTCGGAFDTGAGSYTDNVIVYARME